MESIRNLRRFCPHFCVASVASRLQLTIKARHTRDSRPHHTFHNTSSNTPVQFQVYDDAFLTLLGETLTLSLILSSANASFPQFHEATILASSSPPRLFISSNQYNFSGVDSPNSNQKSVTISSSTQDSTTQRWSSEIITLRGSKIHLANGGTVSPDGILILCAQGGVANSGGLLQLNSAVLSLLLIKSTTILEYLSTILMMSSAPKMVLSGSQIHNSVSYKNIQSVPQLPAQGQSIFS